MPLLNCEDCSGKMSLNAEECPDCGCPNYILIEHRKLERLRPTWGVEDDPIEKSMDYMFVGGKMVKKIRNKKKKKEKEEQKDKKIQQIEKTERISGEKLQEELQSKGGKLNGCLVWGLLIFAIWIIYNAIKALLK